MTLTKEEANAQLTKAIADHATAHDLLPDQNAMLGDFAIIASWTPFLDEGTTEYTCHFHRDTVPDHIIRGLFALALELNGSEEV